MADRNLMGSQLLAESLGKHPGFEIVGVAATAEMLRSNLWSKTDVAVISLESDSETRTGLQVARTVNKRQPNIRVVALLEKSTPDLVIAAFRCGATGVFSRTEPISDLPACIERVNRGEIWASSDQCQFLLDALKNSPSCQGVDQGKIGALTQRELQVAEHAVQGQSNKQIADQLGLSEHTIKNYLFRIFEKLGVSSRIELLFLLFKECNTHATSLTCASLKSDVGQTIEFYLKAAEEGVVAAQYILGLAHLEGHGVEKNDFSAYYWLRMAEENSGTIGHRSRVLIEKLRSTVKTNDIEAVEDRIASGIQEDKLLRANRPAEFISAAISSRPLQMVRETSSRDKSKAAS